MGTLEAIIATVSGPQRMRRSIDMPRVRRRPDVSAYKLGLIEKQVEALRREMSDASRTLTPFCPHDDALTELHGHLLDCLNVLHGRPKPWRQPHGSFFKPGDVK